MLSAARRLRLGVSAAFAPRKPMRSARAESSEMSTRLGLDAAAATPANETLRKATMALATSFRIMTISVKAGPQFAKVCKSLHREGPRGRISGHGARNDMVAKR